MVFAPKMVFASKKIVFVVKKIALSQSKTFWGKSNLLCRKAKRFEANPIFFVAKQNVLGQIQSSLPQSKTF